MRVTTRLLFVCFLLRGRDVGCWAPRESVEISEVASSAAAGSDTRPSYQMLGCIYSCTLARPLRHSWPYQCYSIRYHVRCVIIQLGRHVSGHRSVGQVRVLSFIVAVNES